MNPAIRVEGLSKRYRIGARRSGQRSLRETLSDLGRDLGDRTRRRREAVTSREETELWALRDVSFTVERGDTVGIIGGNGAGKSTLLKILSRITEPTTGHALIEGRVASLIEVGTGFHGDLTGRENIFLNGAILGMRSAEIRRKFDEIVEFSEIGRQLDTPVKHFSSGMYMRLAFAVAAFLEQEVLVVDEVLAVGDEAFQRKCLGKMEKVSGEGRTVLFVSHNLSAVEKLCRSAVWLRNGRVERMGGDVRGILGAYHEASSGGPSALAESTTRVESAWLALDGFRLVDADGRVFSGVVPNDVPAFVEIDLTVRKVDRCLEAGYTLFDEDEAPLFVSGTMDAEEGQWPEWRLGRLVLRSPLPRRLLNEGSYRVAVYLNARDRAWIVPPGPGAPSFRFKVRGGLNDSPVWNGPRQGKLAPVIRWEASCPGK